MQNRNKLTDTEKKLEVTKGDRERGGANWGYETNRHNTDQHGYTAQHNEP